MKTTLLAMSLLLVQSLQAADKPLNLDYGSLQREVMACQKTLSGCTIEQQIEIAKWKGNILTAYDLQTYVSKDSDKKSVFIPLELNNTELITLAAAASLGVVAFNHDQEISDFVSSNQTQTARKISDVGNFMGTGTASLGIAAGSYFMGVVFKDNKLKQVGLFLVGSSVAEAIVTETVKRSFGRKRPSANVGPYSFFNDPNTSKSFYSGHTAQAFTLATVIAESYKEDYPIVPYVAYGVAAITAYARVHDRAHWASDVLIGAVMGHLITKLALNAMNKNDDGRGGLEITPTFDPRTGGVGINAVWTERMPEQALKCSKMPEGTLKINACIDEVLNSKR